jgi:hypothetical protein
LHTFVESRTSAPLSMNRANLFEPDDVFAMCSRIPFAESEKGDPGSTSEGKEGDKKEEHMPRAVFFQHGSTVVHSLLDVAHCLWVKLGWNPPAWALIRNDHVEEDTTELKAEEAKEEEPEEEKVAGSLRYNVSDPNDPVDVAIGQLLNNADETSDEDEGIFDVKVKRVAQISGGGSVGKVVVRYRFGDDRELYLVRIVRNTLVVRVGGGWITLIELLRRRALSGNRYRNVKSVEHVVVHEHNAFVDASISLESIPSE